MLWSMISHRRRKYYAAAPMGVPMWPSYDKEKNTAAKKYKKCQRYYNISEVVKGIIGT